MKKPLKVMSPEEADAKVRAMNLARTPSERVEALLELRNAWLKPDQRRIERVCRVIDIPQD